MSLSVRQLRCSCRCLQQDDRDKEWGVQWYPMGLWWSCEMPPVTVFKDHCKFVNYYSSQLLENNCKKTGCLWDIEMGSEQKKKSRIYQLTLTPSVLNLKNLFVEKEEEDLWCLSQSNTTVAQEKYFSFKNKRSKYWERCQLNLITFVRLIKTRKVQRTVKKTN